MRSVATWDAPACEAAAGSGASHVLMVGEVADAGETERLGAPGDDDAILTMTDTRMNYGG